MNSDVKYDIAKKGFCNLSITKIQIQNRFQITKPWTCKERNTHFSSHVQGNGYSKRIEKDLLHFLIWPKPSHSLRMPVFFNVQSIIRMPERIKPQWKSTDTLSMWCLVTDGSSPLVREASHYYHFFLALLSSLPATHVLVPVYNFAFTISFFLKIWNFTHYTQPCIVSLYFVLR